MCQSICMFVMQKLLQFLFKIVAMSFLKIPDSKNKDHKCKILGVIHDIDSQGTKYTHTHTLLVIIDIHYEWKHIQFKSNTSHDCIAIWGIKPLYFFF